MWVKVRRFGFTSGTLVSSVYKDYDVIGHTIGARYTPITWELYTDQISFYTKSTFYVCLEVSESYFFYYVL